MRVVFRVDASETIGGGHVMRCLALADALRRDGADCHFICRELTGHLLETIGSRGYATHALPMQSAAISHADWRVDAEQTRRVVEGATTDWLVIDHYQLGRDWEQLIRPVVGRILAIDDIGRSHDCHCLLDQNFSNPTHARYADATARGAELLLGPHFALLGYEFAELRERALSRRNGSLRHLLVTMGGADPSNETSKVLAGLRESAHSRLAVDVVVGAANPNRQAVATACARLPAAKLHVQSSRMAELMVTADCAITAGGSTMSARTLTNGIAGLSFAVIVVGGTSAAVAGGLA